MRKVSFAVLLVVLMAGVAYSSPYLVCDPQTGVEYYVITGLPIVADHVLPDTVYGFKLDLAELPPGSYTVRAKACDMWGCSIDPVPFSFVRPAQGSGPINIRLVQ